MCCDANRKVDQGCHYPSPPPLPPASPRDSAGKLLGPLATILAMALPLLPKTCAQSAGSPLPAQCGQPPAAACAPAWSARSPPCAASCGPPVKQGPPQASSETAALPTHAQGGAHASPPTTDRSKQAPSFPKTGHHSMAESQLPMHTRDEAGEEQGAHAVGELSLPLWGVSLSEIRHKQGPIAQLGWGKLPQHGQRYDLTSFCRRDSTSSRPCLNLLFSMSRRSAGSRCPSPTTVQAP